MMSQTSSQIDELGYQSALAQAVCEHGWLHVRADGSKDGLAAEASKLAQRLGEPMAVRKSHCVEVLAPSHVENAKTNSLSKQHGLGPFPLHIDGAHLSHPPRFILLACARPGLSTVPTVLVHFHDLRLCNAERRRCEATTFLVRNGRQSFYSTILDRSRPFIRFDPGCMTPTCNDSRDAAEMIALRAAELGPTAFYWQAGDILIIDNWQVLHGRGLPLSFASPDRRILRVSIR